jgi:hypothetical protein
MTKLAIGSFLLGVMACAACNGDSSASGPPTDPFVGNWLCTETLSINFTAPPSAGMQTRMDTSTLSITAAAGVLTATKQSDSGAGCKVSFTSNGSSATLSEGQTCTTPEGISLSYKSGSATVSGSSMSSTR